MFIKKLKLEIKLLITVAVIFAAGADLYGAFEYSNRTAREEGMGGAYVALADDSSSVFNNPAGLSFLYTPELLSGYGGLFLSLDDGELSDSLVNFAYPVQRKFLSGIGLGWSRLQAGDLYTEDAFVLGSSVIVKENLSLGVGFKLMSVEYGEDEYTKINPVFDSGYDNSLYSADIGILYKPASYSLGLGAYNINSPDMGLKYTNRIPVSLKAGINLASKISNISLQGEYKDEDITFALGGERQFFNRRFFMRGGLRIGSRNYRTASLGLSYADSWYKVDYALIYPLTGISNTLGTHKINLTFYFAERVLPEPEEPELDSELEKEGEISEEDIERSRELTEEAEELIEEGDLGAAYEALEESIEKWEENKEAEEIMSEIKPITQIYETLDERNRKNTLISKAVSAYLEDKGREALNRARYASQQWPDDANLQQLRSVVEKKFSVRASQETLIPGLNIVEQKLQEVLELIYDKRWVRAISLCEEVLDLEPDNVLALKRMGSAYFGLGRREQAREVWRRALLIAPEDQELKQYLGIEEPEKSVDESLVREFENAVNYYNMLVEAGADAEARIKVLERIISTYRGTGVELESLEEELRTLRR